jgi:hypothetical protein
MARTGTVIIARAVSVPTRNCGINGRVDHGLNRASSRGRSTQAAWSSPNRAVGSEGTITGRCTVAGGRGFLMGEVPLSSSRPDEEVEHRAQPC